MTKQLMCSWYTCHAADAPDLSVDWTFFFFFFFFFFF
jgi:hypothetical protein